MRIALVILAMSTLCFVNSWLIASSPEIAVNQTESIIFFAGGVIFGIGAVLSFIYADSKAPTEDDSLEVSHENK